MQQATNLLDHLLLRFNIDTNRVYVAGWSAGFSAACDLLALRCGFFAGGLLLAADQRYTNVSSIKDVPLWLFCARNDDWFQGIVPPVAGLLRAAGGSPLCTEYLSGGHIQGGCLMGVSTPAVVDWLLAQRRGVAPTNEPLLAITNPTSQPVLFTGATNLNLGRLRQCLGSRRDDRCLDQLRQQRERVASGTNLWSATNIPLVANKTNVVAVVASTTSWAPAMAATRPSTTR